MHNFEVLTKGIHAICHRLAMWQDNWYRFLNLVQPFPGILVSFIVHRLCISVRTYQFFSFLHGRRSSERLGGNSFIGIGSRTGTVDWVKKSWIDKALSLKTLCRTSASNLQMHMLNQYSSMSSLPGATLTHEFSFHSLALNDRMIICRLAWDISLEQRHRSVAVPWRARCCTGIGLLMYRSAELMAPEARIILSASCCSYCSDRYCRSSIWLCEMC